MSKAHDHPGIGTYATVWVLLLLAAGSSLVMSQIKDDQGHHMFSHQTVVLFSLVIGFAKAFVVLWYFMHLSEARFPSRVVISVAALLFILLVSITAADPVTRVTMPYRNDPTDNSGFYKANSQEAMKAAKAEHGGGHEGAGGHGGGGHE